MRGISDLRSTGLILTNAHLSLDKALRDKYTFLRGTAAYAVFFLYSILISINSIDKRKEPST